MVGGRGPAGTGLPSSVGSGRSRAAQSEGWRQDGSPGALLWGFGVPGCPAGRQAGSKWLAASPVGICHGTLGAAGDLSPAPLTVSPGEMRSALSTGLFAPVGHVRAPRAEPLFHWPWRVTRPHLSGQSFPPADPRSLAGGLREGTVAGPGSQPARGKLTPLPPAGGARNQV